MSRDDIRFMGEALTEAERVSGRTGDNPHVGCVIVHNGSIIARGATQPPGGPHAEIMAIRQAEEKGETLRGSEIFVTLEPCTFHGRTPPCTSQLIEKAPSRVVIGITDPHPLVNGKGIEELKAAGIEVVVGILQDEIALLLSDWLARFRNENG